MGLGYKGFLGEGNSAFALNKETNMARKPKDNRKPAPSSAMTLHADGATITYELPFGGTYTGTEEQINALMAGSAFTISPSAVT